MASSFVALGLAKVLGVVDCKSEGIKSKTREPMLIGAVVSVVVDVVVLMVLLVVVLEVLE